MSLTLYNSVTTVFTVIMLRTERSRSLDFNSQHRQHFFFSPLLWQTLGKTHSLLQDGYYGLLRVKHRNVRLTSYLHLVLMLRMRGAMSPLHHTSLCRGACLRRGTYYIYVCVAFEWVAVTLHQPRFCSPTAGRMPLKPLPYADHAMCPSRSLHAKDTLARNVFHGCCLQFCLRFCPRLSFFVGYRQRL